VPSDSLAWIAWFACALLASRLVPERRRLDLFALAGMALLAFISPWSCLAMAVGTLLCWWFLRDGRRRASMLWFVSLVCFAAAILLAHGLRMRVAGAPAEPVLVLLGCAYFSCRMIHLAFEGHTGRLADVGIRDLGRYIFFLPTILVGPINRYGHFERAARRRREDPRNFYSGLERALLGAAKVAVVANLLVEGQLYAWLRIDGPGGFAGAYLMGCVGWVWLYFTFSGYADMAIGFAGAAGVAVEENFDRPWAARNLVEFWQRWHITLSAWCRDYIYAPIAASTRRHGFALLAAMLVMGAWHELSVYYALWGCYHAIGIALCRVLGKRLTVSTLVGRLATFAWLAGCAPVIALLLEHGRTTLE